MLCHECDLPFTCPEFEQVVHSCILDIPELIIPLYLWMQLLRLGLSECEIKHHMCYHVTGNW